MPVRKTQQARPIDQQHGLAQEPRCIQGLHADEPLHHLRAEALPAGQGDVAEEVVEGVVDRQRGLVGLGQSVQIGKDLRTAVPQFVIELASRAQLQQVQEDAPPGEEASGVGARFLDAAVGEAVEPGIEVGEEVSDGLDESATGDQGRPALSVSSRALAFSSATERRWISRSSRLSRLCSASHDCTSGRSSLGT